MLPATGHRQGYESLSLPSYQASQVAAALTFSIFSVLMININKGCMYCYDNANQILIAQSLSSLFFVMLANWFSKQADAIIWDFAIARRWTVVAAFFAGNLFTSFKTLGHVNVSTFTVIRNCQPFATVLVEWILFSKRVHVEGFFFLVMAFCGAAIYAWGDITYSPAGYFWRCCHVASMAGYLSMVKYLSTTFSLSAQTMSFYNNLLSLPIFMFLSWNQNEKLGDLSTLNFSSWCIWVIISSCFIGLGISLSAFRVQKLLSPTAFVTLNNACKVPAIWASVILFGGNLSHQMLFGMFLSLSGAFLYALAQQKRAKPHKESQWKLHVARHFIARFLSLRNGHRRLLVLPLVLALAVLFPREKYLRTFVQILEQRKKLRMGGTLQQIYQDCHRSTDVVCSSTSNSSDLESMKKPRIFACTVVPGHLNTGFENLAPHGACLNGSASFAVCSKGAFFCACELKGTTLHDLDSQGVLKGGLSRKNVDELLVSLKQDNELNLQNWSIKCPTPQRIVQPIPIPTVADFKGSDYRLGNLLDRWYAFGCCEKLFGMSAQECFPTAFMEYRILVSKAPLGSFGNFLTKRPPKVCPKVSSGRSQIYSEHSRHHWWIYNYSRIRNTMPEFGESLDIEMQQYMNDFQFSVLPFKSGVCVVHYRLGDMLSHGHFLEPADMARRILAWSQNERLIIESFHILASGNLNFRSSESESKSSSAFFSTFLKTLKDLFPGIDVVLDTAGTPDEDWFKMATSPMLFTAHGSYSVSAAVVNKGYIATPAMENLNFPGCETSNSSHFTDKWTLYECKNA